MAPGRIDSPVESTTNVKNAKPTVYLIDTFHPTAVAHAQSKFNAVLPSQSRPEDWRENAEYLLIRGSYITEDDVASYPQLKAIVKQGVGMHIIFSRSLFASTDVV